MSFEDFAKGEGLSLMLWESDVYASSDTDLANKAFKAGQQSLQIKLNKLRDYILENHVEGEDAEFTGKVVNLIETEKLLEILK